MSETHWSCGGRNMMGFASLYPYHLIGIFKRRINKEKIQNRPEWAVPQEASSGLNDSGFLGGWEKAFGEFTLLAALPTDACKRVISGGHRAPLQKSGVGAAQLNGIKKIECRPPSQKPGVGATCGRPFPVHTRSDAKQNHFQFSKSGSRIHLSNFLQ
ncbi:MAG: hypothetical protein FWD77_07345 [Betaproteobacteria bacterium]|nr:hypothetical protein [Betaproteobacteria bacterium]